MFTLEKFIIFLKGFLMGVCDIIPGVSGGTIAFITGIYDKLVGSVAAIDHRLIKDVIRFDFKSINEKISLDFLIPLGLGILMALISTANLVHYLLKEHDIFTWSFFFGLILASILYLARDISWKILKTWFFFIFGTVFAYFLVGMIPINTPEAHWFIFVCGLIAISAMILPGISGSFILLLLGKYEYITNALRNPFIADNIYILISFVAGAAISMVMFSKVLNFLLARYKTEMFALLTGFILGALRKIWPWKQVVDSKVIRGKTYAISEMNVFPEMNSHSWISFGIMIFALILVIFLLKISDQKR